tara:strand:- start:977 stop:1162 length:186 start_codon:yes stop_codon:yes gene_type:complete
MNNIITIQIAIESLQINIESLREQKKVVPKNMIDYLNTKIKDMEIAQNELAMKAYEVALNE